MYIYIYFVNALIVRFLNCIKDQLLMALVI